MDAAAPDAATDAGVPDAATDPLEVTISLGTVRGTLIDGVRTFLGIPYAKPPVGALRFMPPEPADPWVGTRTTTAFGPSCPQSTEGLPAQGPQSEDCLTLNVYAPAASTGKLPVMVWLYGGAFVSGGSVMYDPSRLSREGPVVVVTLNYRLGILGLLVHPQLDGQRSVPSGNDALRDQQLALTFVRDNIAKFGGDPDNVTLFGESAGSMSACLQMVSPPADGLADRYILQSATCVGGLPIDDRPKAEARGARVAEALCPGASDPIACLRQKPAAELVAFGAKEGISGAGWAPVLNPLDPVLPKHPIRLLTESRSSKPVIAGSNRREWALFVAFGAPIASLTELRARVAFTLTMALDPSITDSVMAHYVTPQTTDADAHELFIRMMTDAFFRCPARGLVRLSAARGQPAYLYHFEEGLAFHASEIPYVFGTPLVSLGITQVEALHAILRDYWLSFAKTGDPNGVAPLAWPRYETASDRHLVLREQPGPSVGERLVSADCDFWEGVANQLPQQ